MLKPIMDRILLRRVEEKHIGRIKKPDAYSESNKYVVLAIGDLVIMGGQRFDVSEFVQVGDVVLVPPYNIEDCELDGEKYLSCRVQDVRGKQVFQPGYIVQDVDRVTHNDVAS